MGLTEVTLWWSTHVSEVGWVCFEHLHREVVPREAEAGAAEAH